ncbi:hypothetical protein BC830DRAFT_1058344 [Chytriomyces sp. MP71]|nr:hypothetical protein BC830DRAFT_1058344 [Chytriomyces sp. MP71]
MLRIGLTSISRRFSSTTASYPYKLHWTPTQQGSLALSFSPLPQAHAATTPRIVGWIKESSGQPQPTPTNFVGNPQFEDAMHQLLKDAIHEDEGWKSMAFNQKQGYLNINDQRVWTPYARVADPEDLLGAVLLKDGSIVPGSYQKTPTHRLVSSNGLVQLSEALHELLVQRLEKL